MSLQANGAEIYRRLPGHQKRQSVPRTGYLLAVSGALAIVTFTLVYLTTLSYVTGF